MQIGGQRGRAGEAARGSRSVDLSARGRGRAGEVARGRRAAAAEAPMAGDGAEAGQAAGGGAGERRDSDASEELPSLPLVP